MAGTGLGALGAVVVLLVFAVIVGSFAMLVVALVDIIRRPDWQWTIAGQEKVLWVLLVLLVNVLAVPSLIYWFAIRKKLMAVERAAAGGQLGPGYFTYAGWQPGPYPPPVPPGWHPDPSGSDQLRWWDGGRWSEHTWRGEPAEQSAARVDDPPAGNR